MKSSLPFVLFCALVVHAVGLTAGVPLMRVMETQPSTTAWVLAGQEQLTGQAFQQDALLTYNGFQYTVYYNATRNVTIARRALPLGKWMEVVLPHQNSADDAHNVISMGICRVDGTIHLAYDHHNTSLQYSRSIPGLADSTTSSSWKAANFGATTSQLEIGIPVPDVTYPRFITKPDGNLLFECRYKLSGDGDSYLREYNGNSHSWKLVGRYIQGMDAQPNACAYINRMNYDVNGRLHITWCWRDDFGGGSNHDLSYAYSDDNGRTWKDPFNQLVASTEPIQPTDSRTSGGCLRQVISSLRVGILPYNKGYINQEAQATDSKGRIHVVNSYLSQGTESDWATARAKAVLHHWYRNTDGTWHEQPITVNGKPVHSYCRVQLLFDAFDNAFVLANGVEILAATAAKGYQTWERVSVVDEGRFCSEPQVDHAALADGVLSFVYLSRNRTLSVIDYLLDNPRPMNGKGLLAEWYSDDRFERAIGTANHQLPGGKRTPLTKSVRWSGLLVTAFAEPYTLYLTTSAATTITINGEPVLNTGSAGSTKTFTIPLKAVCSHKSTLVIESKATNKDVLSLAWSSRRTPKTLIPTSHFQTAE